MRNAVIYILFLMLLLSSCNPDRQISEEQKEFILKTEMGYYIDNVPVIIYDQNLCQESYNKVRNQYRIQTDIQDTYLQISFSKEIKRQKTFIEVVVNYMSGNISNLRSFEVEVLKLEGGKAWLWNEDEKYGLIVRLM